MIVPVFSICLFGLFVFVAATAVLGASLRREPSRRNAERASRIIHLLFFVALTWPPLLVFIEPGITRLDAAVGLSPLEPAWLLRLAGLVLTVPGTYFFVTSNRLLRSRGDGANAFRLTRFVVAQDVYERTRNPMALGWYLLCAGLGLVTGSTLFTAWVLGAMIPAHLFCLKYFEEFELGLRLGEPYQTYRQKTPFLIPALRRSTGV